MIEDMSAGTGAAVELYRDALQRIDLWFEAARQDPPGLIPCRAGCDHCCHGPFDVSAADAVLLLDGVARLDPIPREAVRKRADALMRRIGALAPDWTPPWDIRQLGEERFDEVAEALAGEPCPLLDEAGACRVYQSRPLVCRLIGLGMMTPAGREIENCCPIRSSFPEYAAMPNRPFDLERWEMEEAACLEAAGDALLGTPLAADYETTIAALLSANPQP